MGTVQVVPPVAHKILLVEDCSIWAEKTGGLTIRLAEVEWLEYNLVFISGLISLYAYLAVCLSIGVNA